MNMDELVNLNRRSMMQQALLLIGATAVPVDMALAAAAPRKRFLAPAQFQLLTALADTIVPVTDTPGALAAGVPAKLDGMLSNWASAATRIKVSDALGRLNGAALASKKKGFAAMTPAERKAVLTDHDKASLKAVPPPPLGLPPGAMLAISSPAQKLRPSPDSTTTRMPLVAANSSPAAMIP